MEKTSIKKSKIKIPVILFDHAFFQTILIFFLFEDGFDEFLE